MSFPCPAAATSLLWLLCLPHTYTQTQTSLNQFDAVHPLLSAQETLYLYGRLRGVPEDQLADVVSYLCSRLTLDQDQQHTRPAKTYSGGNRRKLSVGVALIGFLKLFCPTVLGQCENLVSEL